MVIIGWDFCVATWHQGRLHPMSPYFTTKWAAECELTQMGNSMNFYVLQGKAWIYRKQTHLPDRYYVYEDEDEEDEDQPEEEPALKRRRTSLLPDWGP